MSNAARNIQEFVPAAEEASAEKPKFLAHLLRMPLTDGKEAMIDPEEIISVSTHRADSNVTVIRQRNDTYVYYIDRPYEIVQSWIEKSFKD